MRRVDRWLAVLRVVAGLWFLKGAVTKVSVAWADGVVPYPRASARGIETMPALLTRYAAEHPWPAYRAYLLETVVPNSAFAHVTALAEVAVGLSLRVGAFTVAGATAGAMQVIFYGFAVQHLSPSQRGFHLVLFFVMLACAAAGAGRTWGVDAWLRRRSARGGVPFA